MTYRNYHRTLAGTPVPRADRERAAEQSSEMVVYHMSKAEMEAYLEERYGKKRKDKPEPTQDAYLALRLNGKGRAQAIRELFNSHSKGYEALERWGIKDKDAEAAALDAMRRQLDTTTDEVAAAADASSTVESLHAQDHAQDDGCVEAQEETPDEPEAEPSLTFTLVCHEDMARTVLEALIEDVHVTARSKGWHDTETPLPVHLALIHSEVSEALEADRKGFGTDLVAEELADVVIRTFDTAAAHGLNLADALLAKMAKNKARAYRHGGRKY
ncbi:hypothetical protein [Alicyclobacillus sendaiensis]|uniref:hypothetical protein n=1 Tax=Alicyclobacillus sendaiensis TaxID=192387 RepID=UPI0026F41DE1|nr:hypothetical protein [Alicyclobacillus sendaiensis]